MCCYGDSKKVIVVHSAEMSVADVDGCRDPVALSAGERGDRDGKKTVNTEREREAKSPSEEEK